MSATGSSGEELYMYSGLDLSALCGVRWALSRELFVRPD